MTRLHRFRLSLGLVLAVCAAAVVTAPAQQIAPVPSTPPMPGPVGASPPPGLPSPAPGASFPALPSPPATTAPSPLASPSAGPASTLAPNVPAGSPPGATARPAIVRFTGELLDLRNGYAFFTTADAFKTGPALKLVDFDTGGPTKLVPGPGIYARATLDGTSGAIVELALTRRKLPTDEAYQRAYQVAHAYVVAGSRTVPAPEINGGQRLTGRAVAVTFYVQVPPTTPLSDTVFITTDASGWVANAMKMDRIDALHYRLTRTYASGTKFAYRYTRGSWTSQEVGEDGLQDDPHQFFVPEVDAKRLTDVVYRWSDQNPGQQQVGPDSIPTPFNPNPFGNLPSGNAHPGIPPASPTPRP